MRPSSPLVAAAILAAGCTALPCHAVSRAARVVAAGELIPGQTAQGSVGDYLLENALVRVLIDDIPRPHGFADTGGNLIDAAPVGAEDRFASIFTMFNNRFGRQARYETISIVDAGGGPATARIRVTGRDSEQPTLEVVTEYSLAPGDVFVRIDTTLTNLGSEPIQQMQVGDAIQWGLTTHFAPGWDNRGRNVPGDGHDIGGKTLDVEWVAGDGLGSSYGVAAPTGTMELSNGSTWSDGNFAYLSIPATGGSAGYSRFFVIGDGSIASISDRVQALRGTPRGTVAGRVTDLASGLPVAGAIVTITSGQCIGTPGAVSRTIASSRADGTYSADLPPGSYRVHVEARDRGSAPCASVDVLAGVITTSDATLEQAATLNWTCRDTSGARVPCKVSLIEPTVGDRLEGPTLGDTHALVGGYAILSPEGGGSLGVPPGTYRAWITRGIEYSALVQDVTLGPGGSASLAAILDRVVDTTGWISADLHVHAANSADSGVTFEMRAQQAACEGLEMVVPTDHDHVSDMSAAIASTGLARWVGTFPGNEVTTLGWGHVNAYPLTPDPSDVRGGALDHAGLSPAEIFAGLRADPKDPVVQINHPRAGGLGYFDLTALNPSTGESPDPLWSSDFDAVEVFNGKRLYQVGAVLADWYHLLNRGLVVSGMGNTDTHQVFSQEIGYPRNFVMAGDDPAAVGEAVFAAAVKAGRTSFTNGPFVEMTVQGEAPGRLVAASGGSVDVRIRVQAPSWIAVDVVNVVVNGRIAQSVPVPATAAVLRLDQTVAVDLDRDSWVAVEIEGGSCETDANNNCVVAGCPGRLDPVVPPLYGTDPVCPYAHSNVVRIDVDGDGAFTPPGNPGLPVEPIAEVRPVDASGTHLRLEEVIRVRGRVTVPSHAFDHRSNLVYFQDESLDAARVLSGGIALYQNGLVHPELGLGDEIDVTGRITQFNGLTELQGVSIDVLREGAAVPDPLVLTVADLRDTARHEQWEGMLVRVNGLRITGGTWPAAGSTANLTVQDASGQTITMRVDSDTDIDGSAQPTEPFDLVGIVGQYTFAAPRLGWYQLMPRSRVDVIETASPLVILHDPAAEDVSSCEATIRWYTNHAASSLVEYGTTMALGSNASDPAPIHAHAVTLTGLLPATTYFVRASSGGIAADAPQFTTAASAIPAMVDGPRVVVVDGNSVQVIWSTDVPSSSEVAYGVSGLDLITSDARLVTDHAVTLSDLAPGTRYAYEVRGEAPACGGGTYRSAPSQFTTPSCAGVTPPGWVRALPEQGLVRLRWELSVGAAESVVERSSDSCGGGWIVIARVPGSVGEHEDRSAPAGAVSCYRVSSTTADCRSAPSACAETSCGVLLGGNACPAGPGHAVISAIQHAGSAGGCDEMVELHNPTDLPYDLGGHFLRYQSAANNPGPAGAAFADGTMIAPRGYFLVATPEWSAAVAEDAPLLCGMAAAGGHVSLVFGPGDLGMACPPAPPAGTVLVDRVGWGTAACPEGAAAAAFVSGETLVRAPGGIDGNGSDSDVNVDDFTVVTGFAARTSAQVAPCVTAGAAPPREVSSAASVTPLLVARAAGELLLSFESIAEATGYSVYAGTIGAWYSHGGSAGNACDVATRAAGTRTIVQRPVPSGSLYLLVTAFNGAGESETGMRSDGSRIPLSEATCAP